MLRYDLATCLGRKSTALVCFASHIDLFAEPVPKHDVCWVGYQAKLRKQSVLFRTQLTVLALSKVFHYFTLRTMTDCCMTICMATSVYSDGGKKTVLSGVELTKFVCVCVGGCFFHVYVRARLRWGHCQRPAVVLRFYLSYFMVTFTWPSFVCSLFRFLGHNGRIFFTRNLKFTLKLSMKPSLHVYERILLPSDLSKNVIHPLSFFMTLSECNHFCCIFLTVYHVSHPHAFTCSHQLRNLTRVHVQSCSQWAAHTSRTNYTHLHPIRAQISTCL